MKIVLWTLGILVGLAVLALGLQILASERVEVVEVHTKDPGGEPKTTRVWIVDKDGRQFLRAGDQGSGWFGRLSEDPHITVTRHGETRSYTATPRPALTPEINRLMKQKYTWSETIIGIMIDRDHSMAIELVPAPDAGD